MDGRWTMISSATGTTWNISGPDFLILYGVVCTLAGVAAWMRWAGIRGSQQPLGHRSPDLEPDLDVYRLATLSGGPARVVMTAATKLYRAGRLDSGTRRGTLKLSDRPAAASADLGPGYRPLTPGATDLELAVVEAVRTRPGISLATLRRDLRDMPAVTAVTSELERSGLLVSAAKWTRLRRELALAGGLLSVLGGARLVAGLSAGRPVGFLVLALLAVVVATLLVVRHLPRTTTAGRRALKHARRDQPSPQAMDAGMAVALGGAGALWLADPTSADGLGVHRSGASGRGASGGCGSGGCGSGGGGCGGGGGGCGG
jgi:uncharacterized protein (TIGR04222 family)